MRRRNIKHKATAGDTAACAPVEQRSTKPAGLRRLLSSHVLRSPPQNHRPIIEQMLLFPLTKSFNYFPIAEKLEASIMQHKGFHSTTPNDNPGLSRDTQSEVQPGFVISSQQ